MPGGGALTDSKAASDKVKDQPPAMRSAWQKPCCGADETHPGLGAGRNVTRRCGDLTRGARDGDAGFCARSASMSRPFCCGWEGLIREQEDLDKAHASWIASQKLEHPQQRLVLEEMMLAIRQAQGAPATARAGHRRNRSGMVHLRRRSPH